MPCTRHRVFLATLICAAKYLNDSSPKNKHWCRYAQMFSQAEINLMEKQLLFLLDYNLSITEEEVCHYAAPFLEQYGYEEEVLSPVSMSSSLPVTPRLCSGPVVDIPAEPKTAIAVPRLAAIPEGTKRYAAPPALDRSNSSSSLGSVGPITPHSVSPTTSPCYSDNHMEVLNSSPHSRRVPNCSEPISIADPDMPPYIAADAKDFSRGDSIVRRIFGSRRHVSA